MSRSKKLHGNKVTIESAQATLPAPSLATHGVDITGWRQGGFAPRYVALALDADGAGTVATPYVYGYDATDTAWRIAGKLNDGNTISLTATAGFEAVLEDVAVFDRIAVGGTVAGGIAVTATAKPIEELKTR